MPAKAKLTIKYGATGMISIIPEIPKSVNILKK